MEIIIDEDEISRVAEWLQEIECGTDEKEQVAHQEQPRTPIRRQYVRRVFDEVSPTDTIFSGASIFDKPHREYHGLESSRQHRDNDSDATSFDDTDQKPLKQPNFGHETGDTINRGLTSIVTQTPAEIQHHITLDSTKPRLVTILSCLQCTLASLPCSRTLPTCMRCIRNKVTSCLLQRRIFTDESLDSPGEPYTSPVLLKFAGEDEEIWQRKMEVKDELMRVWSERRDKENWVLPKVDVAKRGGWKKYGRYDHNDVGVGEGTGRLRFVEVTVDEEIVRA
jgi:hypothetical protein